MRCRGRYDSNFEAAGACFCGRQFHNAIATFLGEKPIRGALPGTTTLTERVEGAVVSVERNWFIKVVVIFAALTGCVLFFMEMWKMLHGGH